MHFRFLSNVLTTFSLLLSELTELTNIILNVDLTITHTNTKHQMSKCSNMYSSDFDQELKLAVQLPILNT